MSAIISLPGEPGDNHRQFPLAFAGGFVAEQELGPAADDRQGIVDLVAGPGGEFRQGFEFLRLERLVELPLELGQPVEFLRKRRQERRQAGPLAAPGVGVFEGPVSALAPFRVGLAGVRGGGRPGQGRGGLPAAVFSGLSPRGRTRRRRNASA